MAMLPGLLHRLEHGQDGIDELRALLGLGGVLEGERLVGRGGADEALALATQRVGGLGLSVALGPVQGWIEDTPTGLGAHRIREALRYAREGEVFALPGLGEVPDGVGRFDAPKAIADAVGCRVEVWKDYR